MQGQASAIYWNDAANNSGEAFFDDGGIAPEYRQLYFEKYVSLNPTLTPRCFTAVEEPAATADLIPYGEFLKNCSHREWAKPQGLVDFVSIFLEKAAAKSAMFGVFRHERHGVVDEATRRRMRLIAPHIRRAAMISKVVSLKQNEAASLTEAMDGLRAGVILVDGDGKILHANVAAHAILDEGCILRASAGRLVSGDARTNAELRVIFAVAAHGDLAAGARGVPLPSAANPAETERGPRAAARLQPAPARRLGQCRSRGRLHPQGRDRHLVAARNRRANLQADHGRTARAVCHRRGRWRAGSGGRARHRADHGAHPSQPRL